MTTTKTTPKNATGQQRETACYLIACKFKTHAEAARYAIAKGWGPDVAEFDGLVRAAEERHADPITAPAEPAEATFEGLSELLANADTPEEHDAFVAWCCAHRVLAWTARAWGFSIDNEQEDTVLEFLITIREAQRLVKLGKLAFWLPDEDPCTLTTMKRGRARADADAAAIAWLREDSPGAIIASEIWAVVE